MGGNSFVERTCRTANYSSDAIAEEDNLFLSKVAKVLDQA